MSYNILKDTSSICLRAGVTGGIGSGKSTVCRIFQSLGVPVYDADTWAKWLIEHDSEVKNGILELFGPQAYDASGAYQRAWVAGIVFQDSGKLAALNALVHPAVERHSSAWHAEQAQNGAPYTIKEAALMIESGSYRHLDFLIVVTAPESVRIERVMHRDGASEEQVRARISKQIPEAERLKHADLVIYNDGKQLLIPQVWQAHRKLLGLNTFAPKK
ncbi:MAG: dephospho-CoA kinase [Saprospiraceae bacterium]|nr:dephospho-CoA kinase [Saprospiraceae bacterium]